MSDPFQISNSKNVAVIKVRVYEIHVRRSREMRACRNFPVKYGQVLISFGLPKNLSRALPISG